MVRSILWSLGCERQAGYTLRRTRRFVERSSSASVEAVWMRENFSGGQCSFVDQRRSTLPTFRRVAVRRLNMAIGRHIPRTTLQANLALECRYRARSYYVLQLMQGELSDLEMKRKSRLKMANLWVTRSVSEMAFQRPPRSIDMSSDSACGSCC